MNMEAYEAAERGAEWLEEMAEAGHVPSDWFWEVDITPDVFDMKHVNKCVLGQLVPDQYSGYDYAVETLMEDGEDEAIYRGFTLPYDIEYDWDDLEDAWRSIINQLRADFPRTDL